MKKLIFLSTVLLISQHLLSQDTFEKGYLFPERNYHYYKSEKSQPQYNSLSDGYDVKFYGFDLEAGNTSVYLSGSVTIGATVVAAILDTFVVELHPDYTIDSIKVNGSVQSFVTDHDDVKIPLSPAVPESGWIEAQVFYHGLVSKSGWSGINHSGNNITYTLTEPLYAKDWFPCKQVLTDKADSVFVFITTDESLKVGSNGLLTAVIPLGGGKVRHEWKTYYPTAFYLISMAIGDYYEYNIYAKPEGLNDSILIQNYLYDASVLDNYRDEIDITAELIEIFSELFGMYPFKDEKYGHCMAPIGGGMEHQTMTTLSGFSFMLVSHELTHMWFGDYVTCGTWQDIWINEGFATYGHLLALEQLDGVFPEEIMEGYHSDQIGYASDGSIYIPENYFDIDYTSDAQVDGLSNRIFSWLLSYEKGAIILHMLRYELNDDELFFHILRTYLSQYEFGTAIGTDFKAVAESESGLDFTDFFDQWYFGEGFPKYDIQWFQSGDTVYIRSVQTTSAASAPLFRMNMDYRLAYNGGESVVRLYQGANEQIHAVYADETITNISVDPDEWLLKEIMGIEQEIFFSLDEISQEGTIILYPNPSSDRLHIQTGHSELPAGITLYDLWGRAVLSLTMDDPQTELDVSTMAPGIYILEVTGSRNRISRKLVVQ